jgi:hypothetical protein
LHVGLIVSITSDLTNAFGCSKIQESAMFQLFSAPVKARKVL